MAFDPPVTVDATPISMPLEFLAQTSVFPVVTRAETYPTASSAPRNRDGLPEVALNRRPSTTAPRPSRVTVYASMGNLGAAPEWIGAIPNGVSGGQNIFAGAPGNGGAGGQYKPNGAPGNSGLGGQNMPIGAPGNGEAGGQNMPAGDGNGIGGGVTPLLGIPEQAVFTVPGKEVTATRVGSGGFVIGGSTVLAGATAISVNGVSVSAFKGGIVVEAGPETVSNQDTSEDSGGGDIARSYEGLAKATSTRKKNKGMGFNIVTKEWFVVSALLGIWLYV